MQNYVNVQNGSLVNYIGVNNASVVAHINLNNDSMGNYVVDYVGVQNTSLVNYIADNNISIVNHINLNNASMGNYIVDYVGIQNTSLVNYIGIQNGSLVNYIAVQNTSMKNYVDYMDLIFNNSIVNWITDQYYTITQVDAINTSMQNYVNVQNSSMVNYIGIQNTSLVNYVGVQNTSMENYVGVQNASINNYLNFFMPLNNSVYGNFDFNDGWTAGGVSIIDGDLYAQTGWFYNITGLQVDTLRVNGSLLPQDSFDNQFDIGNATLRWNDLHLGGTLYVAGVNISLNNDSLTNFINLNNASMGNYIVDYVGIQNTSLVNYIGIQNGSLVNYIAVQNTSMKNYVDYMDLIFNNSIVNWITDQYYTITQVDAINTSMQNYVNVQNSSMVNYIGIQNTSLVNYVGVQNTSLVNYIGVVNTTRNNYVTDTFVPYSGGSKNLDLGANNFSVDSSVLFVDSENNRVGIGTTGPGKTLDVAGQIRVLGRDTAPIGELKGAYIMQRIDTADIPSLGAFESAIYAQDLAGNDAMVFALGSSVSNYVFNNGNVGIGTTSPVGKLQVANVLSGYSPTTLGYTTVGNIVLGNAGSAEISANDYAALNFHLGATGRNTAMIGLVDEDGTASIAQRLFFSVRSGNYLVERMAIDESGNVGIGTTEPIGIFHIEGVSPFITGEDSSGGTDEKIWKMGFLDSDFRLLTRKDDGTPGADALTIYRTGTTVDKTILYGNVGIGTTSPNAKLHVAGDVIIDLSS